MSIENLPPAILIMGVSGSGKSTVGKLLAESTGYLFIDADDLHPQTNKQLMAAGIPLTDSERLPWLEIIGSEIVKTSQLKLPVVIACSALKRSYRDLLRKHSPNLYFVFLDGSKTQISTRMSARTHEFMPSSLLDSQFENLEPLQSDEFGMRIDIADAPNVICSRIVSPLTDKDRG